MSSDTPKPRRTLTRPAKPAQPAADVAPASSSRNASFRSKGSFSQAPAGKPGPGAPMRSVRSNVWRADAPAQSAGAQQRFGRDDGGTAPDDRREGSERAPYGQRAERPRFGQPQAGRGQRTSWPARPPGQSRPRDGEGASAEGERRTGRPMRQERGDDAGGRRARFQDDTPRRAPLAPAIPTQHAESAPARTQPHPVAAHAEGQRLNKRMADLGLCSRREADEWIANGWVLVNGQPAEMGRRVEPDDAISIDKAAQGQQSQRVTILIHKPVGYVSGQPEDGYQSAASLINPRSHWREDHSRQRFSPQQFRGLAPAGRLDIDSTGLLVLTQDGRIARQLIGEDSTVDKEYLVRVQYQDGSRVVTENVEAVFPHNQLALLRHGLSLDGQPLLPAQVDWQNTEQLRFVLVEGKKRQIRRMCEAVGLKVVGLKRIRIGRVMLGNLPVGAWRYLAPGERFSD